MNRNVYSVTDITGYLKRLISEDFLCSSVSIRGELSNVKYHSSGHIYFTLKDAGAALSCIMFAGDRRGLTFRMEDGQQVICSGSIGVFEQAGRYQLYVRRAEQAGAGALYAEFERIKAELAEMGMFDAAYKQPIPALVQRLGVVTSPTGAARRDIEQIAHRRNPYVQIILYPALVQGEGAVDSVVRGIHALERENVDVMIVGRGGGSMEDLWAFNSPAVAQAVFDCQIPVISAVGHETDTTIIDFVSDLRAPTPSAAAELAVCDIFALLEQLEDRRSALERLMKGRLESSRMRVEKCRLEMEQYTPARVLENRKLQCERMRSELIRLMRAGIQDGKMNLVYREDALQEEIANRMQQAKHRLSLLAATLDAVSPLKRLAGGYAYVQGSDGRGIRSIRQTREGDTLSITLTDGNLEAKVGKVSEFEPLSGNGEE